TAKEPGQGRCSRAGMSTRRQPCGPFPIRLGPTLSGERNSHEPGRTGLIPTIEPERQRVIVERRRRSQIVGLMLHWRRRRRSPIFAVRAFLTNNGEPCARFMKNSFVAPRYTTLIARCRNRRLAFVLRV